MTRAPEVALLCLVAFGFGWAGADLIDAGWCIGSWCPTPDASVGLGDSTQHWPALRADRHRYHCALLVDGRQLVQTGAVPSAVAFRLRRRPAWRGFELIEAPDPLGGVPSCGRYPDMCGDAALPLHEAVVHALPLPDPCTCTTRCGDGTPCTSRADCATWPGPSAHRGPCDCPGPRCPEVPE